MQGHQTVQLLWQTSFTIHGLGKGVFSVGRVLSTYWVECRLVAADKDYYNKAST